MFPHGLGRHESRGPPGQHRSAGQRTSWRGRGGGCTIVSASSAMIDDKEELRLAELLKPENRQADFFNQQSPRFYAVCVYSGDSRTIRCADHRASDTSERKRIAGYFQARSARSDGGWRDANGRRWQGLSRVSGPGNGAGAGRSGRYAGPGRAGWDTEGGAQPIPARTGWCNGDRHVLFRGGSIGERRSAVNPP